MRWVGLTVAAAAAVSTGAQAQTTEPASTTSPTVVESAVTPNPPEPTPLAAALKADPTLTSATGVTRYDPAFFAASQPTTAMDMLNHIPGFTFDGGDQVRGFAGAAGNVLLDGTRPTTKQDDLQSILRRVSASQVDHIDVIRGGAPGIDMQGKTVIANIVRKKGAGLTGTFAVAEDWLPDDGRDRKSIRLEGVKRWADGKVLEASILSGQFVDDGAGDGPRVRTDANGNVLIKSFLNTQGDGIQTNANTAFETPLAGGKFRINASLFMQPYDYREVDQLSFPTTDVITERDEQDRVNTELGAHYERAFGAKINFEGLVIRQDRQQDLIVNFNAPGDAEVFTQNNQSSETIGRAIVRYKYSDKLSFEAAAEGAFNALDSASAFRFNGVDVPLPAGEVRVEEKRGEVSLQGTWKPTDQLVLEAGVRAETSTITAEGPGVDLEKSLFYPKPRAVLTWSPSKENQIRVRLEREVGQLNFDDFAANAALNTGSVRVGNPDIVPQQAWVFEAAYERRFWETGAATLTLRHAQLSDAIDRVPVYYVGDPNDPSDDFVFDAPGNIGDGTKNEIELGFTLPLDRLGLPTGVIRGSGVYRQSEVTDPTSGETRRISGQHPFDYDLHFSHTLKRYKTEWGVDVFNRFTETYYRLDEIDVTALKTFVVLFAEWKPKPDTSWRLEINNIFSRGLSQIRYRYQGPRDAFPLQYIDRRDLNSGPLIHLRYRKTFG